MKRRLLLSFAALILSTGLSQTALADPVNTFILTLSNANQGTIPGGFLSYSGTITNTSGSSINLDAIEFNVPSIAFDNSIDTNPFYLNAAQFLSPGSAYTGILFNVNTPLSSAITTFSGIVNILGDSGGPVFSSTQVGFSTTVTPEPSSWLLLATGLVGLTIAYRFRPQTALAMTRL